MSVDVTFEELVRSGTAAIQARLPAGVELTDLSVGHDGRRLFFRWADGGGPSDLETLRDSPGLRVPPMSPAYAARYDDVEDARSDWADAWAAGLDDLGVAAAGAILLALRDRVTAAPWCRFSVHDDPVRARDGIAPSSCAVLSSINRALPIADLFEDPAALAWVRALDALGDQPMTVAALERAGERPPSLR